MFPAPPKNKLPHSPLFSRRCFHPCPTSSCSHQHQPLHQHQTKKPPESQRTQLQVGPSFKTHCKTNLSPFIGHPNNADKESSEKSQKKKTFSLSTYKTHALGDYVETIRRYGTTDSYNTEQVLESYWRLITKLIMLNREN